MPALYPDPSLALPQDSWEQRPPPRGSLPPCSCQDTEKTSSSCSKGRGFPPTSDGDTHRWDALPCASCHQVSSRTTQSWGPLTDPGP